MAHLRRRLAALTTLSLLVLAVPGATADEPAGGRVGPDVGVTGNGRAIKPVGRQTSVGNFPTGAALTPDGGSYWVVDSGHGRNDVKIVDVASGSVRQTLPLPGGNGGVAFAPDGRHAYVSGTPKGGSTPDGPTKGDAGDVVHVFAIDPVGATASEQDPIALPRVGPGSAQQNSLPPVTSDFPGDLAVSPDGKTLAVVLTQADRVALIDVASRAVRTVKVGSYPHGVAIGRDSKRAYVSNELDGSLSVVDLAAGSVATTIKGLGGERGDAESHPEGVLSDPTRARVYVAVAQRDLIAVVDTDANVVTHHVSVGRGAIGVQPVALGISSDARTLYSADSGDDSVAAISLVERGAAGGASGSAGSAALSSHPVVRVRSVAAIARYRARLGRARSRLRRSLQRVTRDRTLSTSARRRALRRRRAAYRRELARLRRTLLGAAAAACAGPSRAQEKRYTAAVLRAQGLRASRLAKARRAHSRRSRTRLRRAAARRYSAAIRAARRLLPAIAACAPPAAGAAGSGDIPGLGAFTLIGKLPTAAYPTAVAATPDGKRLLWTAGKGYGAGPNPDFLFEGDKQAFGNVETPYGSYVPDKLIGRVGVLDRPGDQAMRDLSPQADAQALPANHDSPRPPGSPIPAAGSGPSAQIEHVFYIVRENRTYDQIFGSDSRGDGAPNLELFDDNPKTADPTSGITPNAHALSRTFPLLDHVYADSEVSVDGHLITAGAIANDYAQRATQANYSDRGRAFDFGIYPVTFGPSAFVFDQAAKQGVSFFNYGEQAAGVSPVGDDGRSTFGQVVANTDQTSYPGNLLIGCQNPPAPPANCVQDSSAVLDPPARGAQSRFDAFNTHFTQQLAAGQVPRLNYMIVPNDHTNGTTANGYSPQALIADNDLAVGQIVDRISHSSIWEKSAIFIVEDDTQDGADHVDAHRMPAFVISPWARTGVVHARYDQYSVLRTIGLILGLSPLTLNDALATPMYAAFLDGGPPRTEATRYTAITPEQSLSEKNPANAPGAAESQRLHFDKLDQVPQAASDRILWRAVHGRQSTPPPPGPNASPVEQARDDETQGGPG